MSQPHPDVSVVIPTRARPASLLRTLSALERQDFPADRIEVLVVDDGDGEAVRLLGQGRSMRLAVSATPNDGRGAAAARNTGARKAVSSLLLFLDDDIEAGPSLVAAHAAAHRNGFGVTTGYLPARPETGGFFAVELRNWWQAMFDEMRRPGHRYGFKDLLTGNCAVDTALFRAVGGFDESLACHEDYELGVRLIEAGARFSFVYEAEGVHHEVTTVARALERKRAEGRADVQLTRKHPQLVDVLRLGRRHPLSRGERALQRLAFRHTAAARVLLSTYRASMDLFEAARMRGRWGVRLHRLLILAYWQGVAGELRTMENLDLLSRKARLHPARPARWLEVDLQEGLEAVLERVDAARPDGLALAFAGEPVGVIAPSPASEPLRAEHVVPALAHELSRPLLLALGRAGSVPVAERDGAFVAAGPLPRESFPMRRSWPTPPCSAPCARGAGRPHAGGTGTASAR